MTAQSSLAIIIGNPPADADETILGQLAHAAGHALETGGQTLEQLSRSASASLGAAEQTLVELSRAVSSSMQSLASTLSLSAIHLELTESTPAPQPPSGVGAEVACEEPLVAPAVAADAGVSPSFHARAAFLFSGDHPRQSGVDEGAIEEKRIAIVSGEVRVRGGASLPNVRVRVHEQPQFGEVLTDCNGRFSIAVNGGGAMVLEYTKRGYLSVHRRVNVPWKEFVEAASVAMTTLDPSATMVAFGQQELHVATGSHVEDESGARQAVVMVPAGTTAAMRMSDGSTQPLITMTARITEYTVGPDGPSAMPATLPPESAYTYAFEVSADEAIAAGARSVEFSKPVPFYVDNFLRFSIGQTVPVGRYDTVKEAWIAENNGRVIAILAAVDGKAQIDISGHGAAATEEELAVLGIGVDERSELVPHQPSVDG